MTPEEYQGYWQEIVNAGGPKSYIDRELRSSGAYRHQRKTAKECFKLFQSGTEKQQQDYIKGARAEQKERSRIRSFVGKSTQILISIIWATIFWSDFFDDDFFDPYNRHKRIEEQELPSIETLDEVISFITRSSRTNRSLSSLVLLPPRYRRDTSLSTILHSQTFRWSSRYLGPTSQSQGNAKVYSHRDCREMSIHGSAHGFVPGKSIYTNAEQHTILRSCCQFRFGKFSFQPLPFHASKVFLDPMDTTKQFPLSLL